MTTAPFLKNIILFALPVMLSGLLQLFYNSADIIVVGRFAENGNQAQAAVNSTSSLVHLIINIFIGLGVGINVCCARRIGAQDSEGTFRVVHTTIALSLICGAFVAVFGFFASGVLLQLMNCPPDVIELSTLYLRIYFLGAPFLMLTEFCSSIMRAKGQTQKPLIYMAISGATNVVLNLILVVVFKMSVAGVGIATITSQAISAVLLLRDLIVTDDDCKLFVKKIKIYASELREIVLIGLPAGIQGSMFSISNVTIQSSINAFGSNVMAGNGNAQQIESYLNTICNSIVQASISFIGQNYGAKKRENIGRVMKNCLALMGVVVICSSTVAVLLRYQLLSIFNPSENVINAGIPRILVNCAFYFLFGYMQLVVGFLRGLGKGITPVIISLCGICLFRIIWVLTVLPFFYSTWTIYVSYPISWALTLIAQSVLLLTKKKRVYEKMSKST